ncbi:MAG: YidH family protein [Cyanobacteriota bacterium]|jgi:putative membrane protein
MALTDELAKQRNRDAAERTLMAWIRTCLSLISFGYGLDKVIDAINRSGDGRPHAELGVRLVGIAFVLTGILSMVAAIRQHRREILRLRRPDFTYADEPSFATGTAMALALIGAVALLLLSIGAFAR